MTFRSAIQGIGVVGGFGNGIDALRDAMDRDYVRPGTVDIGTEGAAVEMPAFLADSSLLTQYIGKKALRRVDHFTRMALLGCFLALDDANVLDSNRKSMGIVVATGYGATRTTFNFLDSILDYGDQCASPIRFSNSVHNAPAAHIAIFLKENGPNLSVSQFEMSFPSALMSAHLWLAEGRTDAVLVGGVDEYCRVLGYCWHRMCRRLKNSSDDNRNAFRRKQAFIGEGSAFFYLTRETGTAPKYGYLQSVQMGNEMQAAEAIPEHGILIECIDGYGTNSVKYPDSSPEKTVSSCFTHLYGSLPVGPAFDMAAGAIMMKENRRFSSLHRKETSLNSDAQNGNHSIDNETVCCLKLGSDGMYGAAIMNR